MTRTYLWLKHGIYLLVAATVILAMGLGTGAAFGICWMASHYVGNAWFWIYALFARLGLIVLCIGFVVEAISMIYLTLAIVFSKINRLHEKFEEANQIPTDKLPRSSPYDFL